MKVCITSLHVNLNKNINHQLLKETVNNWRQYASTNGYDVRFFDNYIDGERTKLKRSHPAWQKLLVFNQLKEYDVVVWVDTDILFTPTAIPFKKNQLEEVIDGKKVLGVREPAYELKDINDDHRRYYLKTIGRVPKNLNLFNTGIFAASPRNVGDAFTDLFWNCDPGNSKYFEEMPAINEYVFNHENMYLEMDPKFNTYYKPIPMMNFIKAWIIRLNLYNQIKYWQYEMSLYPNKNYIKSLINNSYAIHFVGGKLLAQQKAIKLMGMQCK